MSSNGQNSPDSPAARIIESFGGLTKAAQAWGKSKSTVQRWKQSGHIRPYHYNNILEAAWTRQVQLDPHDFILVDTSHPAFGKRALKHDHEGEAP